MARFFGIAFAVSLHVGFLLFGGLIFPKAEESSGTFQEVELLAADEADEDEQKEPEPAAEESEPLETEAEEVPDAAEIIRNLELASPNETPMLEEASLSAIEQALNGQGGAGDFADALSFSSGGRIGGTGKAGALEESLEEAFSLSEIDQKPRAIFQAAPLYPSELRAKKLEGVVTLIFVVDASGKVSNPRVEKSTHPAFDRPALDALRRWKFEPAVKGGQRVGCKMRVPIRFQPS